MEYEIEGFQYKVTVASKHYKVIEGVLPKVGSFLILLTFDKLTFKFFEEDSSTAVEQSLVLQVDELSVDSAIDWMLTILDALEVEY